MPSSGQPAALLSVWSTASSNLSLEALEYSFQVLNLEAKWDLKMSLFWSEHISTTQPTCLNQETRIINYPHAGPWMLTWKASGQRALENSPAAFAMLTPGTTKASGVTASRDKAWAMVISINKMIAGWFWCSQPYLVPRPPCGNPEN